MMRQGKIEQFHKEFFHKMQIVLTETDGTYELYDKFFGEWLRTET